MIYQSVVRDLFLQLFSLFQKLGKNNQHLHLNMFDDQCDQFQSPVISMNAFGRVVKQKVNISACPMVSYLLLNLSFSALVATTYRLGDYPCDRSPIRHAVRMNLSFS